MKEAQLTQAYFSESVRRTLKSVSSGLKPVQAFLKGMDIRSAHPVQGVDAVGSLPVYRRKHAVFSRLVGFENPPGVDLLL